MFVPPHSKLARERKFAEQVREELLARGRFSCDKTGTLTFNVEDGRVFKVTLSPACDFGRFVSATLAPIRRPPPGPTRIARLAWPSC
jgi:hypothetical protein